MSLAQLSVRNVRCIEQAELELGRGPTLLWGPNGSGKTSLLEAIFMLGRGRSFRTRNNERVIRHGQDQLRVSGAIIRESGAALGLSIEVGSGRPIAQVGGRAAQSLAELSQEFPVQVIDPGIHRLVEEGGYWRRRWLDWAVFHVEPPFVDTWQRYTRTLRQRNAALATGTRDTPAWDAELARLGEVMAQSRERLVSHLQPYWRETVVALSGLPVELHYQRGWAQELTLAQALDASRARDLARHLTHVGPHRADVAVRLAGRRAREVLSRGQQKLVAVAMAVAQLKLLQALSELRPTLLLDDPAAELDADHLQRFIGQVGMLRCQLVVTSLHAESRLFGAPERTFRVGQGRVQPV